MTCILEEDSYVGDNDTDSEIDRITGSEANIMIFDSRIRELFV